MPWQLPFVTPFEKTPTVSEMYEYLKGNLISKSEAECVLEVNGAGYLLNVTPFLSHHEGDRDVLLYIRTFIRDDGEHTLYGFEERPEREIFDFLRGIKGIGPRTAIRILSRVRWNELCGLVKDENIDLLAVRSRLGEKTLKRIIVELKPRLEKLFWDGPLQDNATVWQETRRALMQLGFSSGEIDRVLRELVRSSHSATDTESMVKEALVMMGGQR